MLIYKRASENHNEKLFNYLRLANNRINRVLLKNEQIEKFKLIDNTNQVNIANLEKQQNIENFSIKKEPTKESLNEPSEVNFSSSSTQSQIRKKSSKAVHFNNETSICNLIESPSKIEKIENCLLEETDEHSSMENDEYCMSEEDDPVHDLTSTLSLNLIYHIEPTLSKSRQVYTDVATSTSQLKDIKTNSENFVYDSLSALEYINSQLEVNRIKKRFSFSRGIILTNKTSF